jgi:SpoIVB peptidase S55
MSPAVRRRGSALVALTASLGLAAGVPALSGGAAQSAEPTPDCRQPFPIADLAAGDPVNGLTVSKGTTPEPFTGEVIGVLENGIAPDLDMVIMDLTSPEIDRVGGIWQGMSGSPVYAENGKLIGAVAYGLTWGSSPVAGITPFEEMDDYLGPAEAPARIRVGKGMAQRIADESDVTATQAAQGFSQLRMPIGVAGLTGKRIAQSEKSDREYLGDRDAYVLGKAAASPDPSTVVAGGNIAAAVAYGDITAAGVGTATSVCNGRVVGFGHPMTFGGKTTLSLHPADAIYVQEDPLGSPFKVANIGDPAGTITDDRLTGITGGFGEPPDSSTITSTVTMDERNRDGSTSVNLPSETAWMTFLQHVANHDRVVDGIIGGSAEQEYTITGTDADGSPFEISFSDRYRSAFDITFESAFDVADLVWGLTSIEGVTVDSVTLGSDVSDDKSTYTITGVQQYKAGEWHPVNRKSPATIKAGRTLKLRAVLRAPDRTAFARYSFAVPKRLHDQKGFFSVTGGNWLYSEAPWQPTVDKIAKAVDAQVRNDATQAQFSVYSERGEFVRTVRSGAFDKVVNGDRSVKVLIK